MLIYSAFLSFLYELTTELVRNKLICATQSQLLSTVEKTGIKLQGGKALQLSAALGGKKQKKKSRQNPMQLSSKITSHLDKSSTADIHVLSLAKKLFKAVKDSYRHSQKSPSKQETQLLPKV